jgi:DNA replication protein DnaC
VRTLLVTATALITTLGKALAESKLEDRLKLLSQPQLLIIDEIGYLPIDRQGANLFFQLVSRRYERGSIIITSNQSLGAWGEVFGDQVIASAILDRLLHHSITVNIKGTQTVIARHHASTVATTPSRPIIQLSRLWHVRPAARTW